MNKIFLSLTFLFLGIIESTVFAQESKISDSSNFDFRLLRERMVAEQIEDRGIKSESVLKALRTVQRHRFVAQELQNFAYQDEPLPIGSGQTISQPYIVALMTELLQLKSNEKVLEIGTGSGYQAAILAELAKEVYTIEILPDLAKRAKKLLCELGYKNIHFKTGDGYLGWSEFSPFDAIIVTCAPEKVPKALIEQLSEGGRMVVPVGTYFQVLKLLTKKKGKIIEQEVLPVRFVPMIKK